MSDVNISIFTGNLVKDCEYKKGDGLSVAYFTIASNHAKMKTDGNGNRKMVEEPFFLQSQIFGKSADNIHEYLTKGIKIALQGHWENSSWEKDGKKVYKNQFFTDSLQFLSKKKENPPDDGIEETKLPSFDTKGGSQNPCDEADAEKDDGFSSASEDFLIF